MANNAEKSKLFVPEFYKGKSIFITGGNGFIGKVLIEKLLRSCPELNKIYILLRPKRNKSVADRLRDLMNVPLFDLLKKKDATALEKLIPVTGDITELQLGLSKEDRNVLIENVSIIFHVAATVRFDDFLKSAILSNIRGTREVVHLAKQLKHIDAFIHTSTAFSNADLSTIEEKLYPAKYDWQKTIEIAEKLDANLLQIMSQKYIGSLPNTYLFTKQLAEQLVVDLCKNSIPAAILRPSIVIPSHSDPMVGWIDNFNGPVGLFMAVGKGILRIVYLNEDLVQDHVFVDNVVKAMIIASWNIADEINLGEISVYNCASEFNMTYKCSKRSVGKAIEMKLYHTPLWRVSVQFTTCWYHYFTIILLTHLLPALLIDFLLEISGRKGRLLKIQRKVYIASMALTNFTMNCWSFSSDRYTDLDKTLFEEDKEAFSLSKKRVNGDEEILEKLLELGENCREYLLKEPRFASEKDVKRYQRLVIVDKTLKFIFYGLAAYLLFWKYDIVNVLFNSIYGYFERL